MGALDDVTLRMVTSMEDAMDLKRWMGERRPILGIDTETEGLDWWRDGLRLVQVGDAMTGWAIPFPMWGGLAQEVIHAYEGPVAFQNAKFDLHTLEHNGGIFTKRHQLHDTKAMSHIADPLGPSDLKGMADAFVDPRASVLDKELSKGMAVNKWTWATVPYDFKPYWAYSALDPVITARVATHLWDRVQPYRELYDMEIAIELLLTDLERRGITVDIPYCLTKRAEIQEEIRGMAGDVEERWGVKNHNSGPQVANALIEAGANLTVMTAKGAWSTKDEVLAVLDHPLAKAIQKLRGMEKHANTYFGNFIEFADEHSILHPNVNPTGARTGRMSVSRPPLQGVPRTKLARDAFVPREGNKLIAADYDQIELRIMAHYANEEGMMEAVREGVDLHTRMAEIAFNTDVVSPDQRRIMKGGSFAKIYGAGVAKFAATIGVPVPQALEFMSIYKESFPGIISFMDSVQQEGYRRLTATGQGFVTTWGGRRLPCDNKKIYTLVNYLIQGSAADVLKMRMLELDRAGLGDFMVMPIHDEILFDVPEADIDEVHATIEEHMPENEGFAIPLSVGIDVVNRWGDKYD